MNIPKLLAGYKRQWKRCKKCGRVQYRDYIPYSMSNPILVAACNHDYREDLEEITADEALIEIVSNGGVGDGS